MTLDLRDIHEVQHVTVSDEGLLILFADGHAVLERDEREYVMYPPENYVFTVDLTPEGYIRMYTQEE